MNCQCVWLQKRTKRDRKKPRSSLIKRVEWPGWERRRDYFKISQAAREILNRRRANLRSDVCGPAGRDFVLPMLRTSATESVINAVQLPKFVDSPADESIM